MRGGYDTSNPKEMKNFAVHSPKNCLIGIFESRSNSPEVKNQLRKRMVMQPHNGIKLYYGTDHIIPNVPDLCAVNSNILGYDNISCNGICRTLKNMTCSSA